MLKPEFKCKRKNGEFRTLRHFDFCILQFSFCIEITTTILTDYQSCSPEWRMQSGRRPVICLHLLFNPELLLRLSENRKVRNITQCDLARYLGGFLCLFNQKAEAIFRQTSVLIECLP